MSMSFGLGTNLKVGTSQKLTPQMQQAIKLLQLSSIELEQEVQNQLDRNPMLERDENGEDALDNSDSLDSLDSLDNLDSLDSLDNRLDSKSESDNGNSNSSNIEKTIDSNNNEQTTTQSSSTESTVDSHSDSFDKLQQNGMDDSAIDTDWDNVYNHESSSGLSKADFSDDFDYQGNTTSNIQDHIRWQLNFKHLSDTDMLIADYLIDSMDESGFIQLELDELYQSFATIASFYQWEESIEVDEIEAVLHTIQSCDPVGVGARNLSECLLIQLNKLTQTTPYLSHAKALLAHSQYLLSNNINALMEATGINTSDIEPALRLIRTLNPAPGKSYTDSQPHYGIEPESYDIPDVLVNAVHVHANGNKQNTETMIAHSSRTNRRTHHSANTDTVQTDISWHVRLNPDTLPKLRINQEYANLVKRGDTSADNTYLKDNLSDAKLFIRSIQERNHNLLKVATCIVKRQEQFLLHGATAMQPLILKEVAEEVELHESTVSRLTTSKSMLTPQGLYSLKYFFSSSVSGCDGDVSSTAICAMIEALVVAEDPKKPLSDSAIAKHLHDKGIDIARRTIAKYREQLNIASSTQRKQRY